MAFREFVVSNDLLDRPEELRARVDQDGYLFFRGLLPREDVIRVRRDILECCREADWLIDGSDLLDGRVRPEKACVVAEPAYHAVYDPAVRMESFHDLAHHPAIHDVMTTIVKEPAFVHPLRLIRLIFPQSVEHTTPAHQDYVFVQGTPETYTAWIPIGDCPRELGGLQVNPDTHKRGIYPEYHVSLGAGGMGISPELLPDNWHSTDYQAGDVLIFHSHLVHQGLPNLTADRLRISTDFRYQAPSQPISDLSTNQKFPWEETYRSWKSTEHQYYWRRYNLNIVPFDPDRFTHGRDAEAFELARQGDPRARAALLRMIGRKDGKGEQARQALAELDRVLAERPAKS